MRTLIIFIVGTYLFSICASEECGVDSSGEYPDCVCVDGVYDTHENRCHPTCPWGSEGVYPNCVCENSGTYFVDLNWCYTCPEGSTGIYPNCECTNGYYSKTHMLCIECPEESTGFYPDCKCQDENVLFSAFINECYIACPNDSSGIHPTCRCDDTTNYYDSKEFACRSKIGKMCPPDATGIAPDCVCVDEHKEFKSNYWECAERQHIHIFVTTGFSQDQNCPDGSGKWPQCSASIDLNVLRSALG